MRKVLRFSLLTSLVAGLLAMGWGLCAFHLVRSEQGVHAYPKKQWRAALSYTDVRSWGVADLPEHPALVEAIVRAGDSELLPAGNAIARLVDLGASSAWVLAGIRMSPAFRSELESTSLLALGQLWSLLRDLPRPDSGGAGPP